eukprot:TRINITY_DN12183_c0_g1_i1.p1 TRINITY_DN12183_c0_g1~~TRINITY_DN12183_c0_g1_i1.p1  ORF type:complete len:359 (+),score=85.72 TRINITY_DN12183_c0_g1_i1:265-1341(+)
MLTHACDPRQPDRRGCVVDNVVDIVSHLARLRCSLSDFHKKLGYVARGQHLTSLLPLSNDFGTLSSAVDVALYSIVSLFHASRPALAPLLPPHAAERRRSALNISDSERISNTGHILELHELPPAYLGESKLRDMNNMQVSVPKPVLLWEDQCRTFNQTHDQLKEDQRQLGDAMLNCRNERVASDRLREILHREAELYVESEELRPRQHTGGQQQQQPQWGQLSGEDLYHEKDALRHRYGELDPLRSRSTHTPFRTTSIYADQDRRVNVLDFDRTKSVVELRLLAISQELEKLQHEKRVLTEGDSNRRTAIETARESIQTRTAKLSEAHDDLNLRRTHAKQLLDRIRKQLQVYEDFLN